MSAEDLRTLFSADETTIYEKTCKDPLIYLYRFCVLTGARPGEALALKKENVKTDRIEVKGSINRYREFTAGKNENAIRSLSLSLQVRLVLLAQEKAQKEKKIKSPFLFTDKNGLPLSQVQFRDGLAKFCKHNGMEIYRPYELRHTFCSMNTAMPEKLKKLVMGHSTNMDTEGVYGHEIDGDLAAAGACVDAAIAKVLGA